MEPERPCDWTDMAILLLSCILVFMVAVELVRVPDPPAPPGELTSR